MITVIKRATVGDYIAFYRNVIPGWVIFNGGERIGMIGVTYNKTIDKHVGYFDIRGELDRAAGVRLALEVKRSLRDVAEDIYVLCEEHTYKTAPRLLRIWGFEPTGETEGDMMVWKRPGHNEGE